MRNSPASPSFNLARSLDQRLFERGFQRFQLMRHRRLRQMQAFRSGSQPTALDHGLQQPQMAKFDMR